MPRLMRFFAVVLTSATLFAAFATPGSAGDYRYNGYVGGLFIGSGIGFGFSSGGFRGHGYRGGPRYYVGPRNYGPYYPYRSRAYVTPRRYPVPVYRAPVRSRLAPGTPEWIAYCARKYKSFNPRTGTYLAYSGKYRYCR